MKSEDYPLLEYDPTIPAIIEPQQVVRNVGALFFVFLLRKPNISSRKATCGLLLIRSGEI